MDTDLRSRALLVSLNVGLWQAAKLDKRATREVIDNANATDQAGNFRKKLFPGCDLLESIKRHAGTVRQTFYANTLAWGLDGTYLLPTKNYMSYMDTFRRQRDEYLDILVPAFLNEYPSLQYDAQRRLGSLYDDADYPSVMDVAKRFRMDIQEFPLPSQDFRLELSDDVTDRIRANLEESIRRSQTEAMRDAWQRLYDRVKHAADKLSDPTAIFRDSLIDNIRETCSVLTNLNVLDDPQMEAMRLEVENTLAYTAPEALRVDPRFRQDAADNANDIANRIGSIMAAL